AWVRPWSFVIRISFGFRHSSFGFFRPEFGYLIMQNLFFYLFALLTLLCAFLVVANPFSRNPVTSAMFLVLTIVSLAGLFVLLHVSFFTAVMLLGYAGVVLISVPVV